MSTWFLIGMGVINAISIVLLLAIEKNISHVTQGHIRFLGPDNKKLVKTKSLLALRLFYLFTVLILPFVFYWLI